jgi:hypothetical protein
MANTEKAATKQRYDKYMCSASEGAITGQWISPK